MMRQRLPQAHALPRPALTITAIVLALGGAASVQLEAQRGAGPQPPRPAKAAAP